MEYIQKPHPHFFRKRSRTPPAPAPYSPANWSTAAEQRAEAIGIHNPSPFLVFYIFSISDNKTFKISFSGNFPRIFPFLNSSASPTPPAMPMSTSGLSGINAHPITATVMGLRQVSQLVLHPIGQSNQVNIGPPTGGTGYNAHPFLPQSDGFENILGCGNFPHRIIGQRYTDGIANSVQQQRTDSRSRFNQPHPFGTRFGHTQVQRVFTPR